MGMSVEENVDVRRREGWFDMNEAEANPVADKINYQRPFEIAVAIAPHHGN